MKTFLLLMALCLPATAQRKAWAWTNTVPEALASATVTGVHAAIADASGAAALVLGESFRSAADEEVLIYRYRLLWLSTRGSVIHQVIIPATAEDFEELMTLVDSPWRVVAVDRGAWVVTNGEKVWSAKVTGKKLEASERDLPADTDAFPAGRVGSSKGWFERKTEIVGTYIISSGEEVPIRGLKELSLWSAK